jgi:hypothetical protein
MCGRKFASEAELIEHIQTYCTAANAEIAANVSAVDQELVKLEAFLRKEMNQQMTVVLMTAMKRFESKMDWIHRAHALVVASIQADFRVDPCVVSRLCQQADEYAQQLTAITDRSPEAQQALDALSQFAQHVSSCFLRTANDRVRVPHFSVRLYRRRQLSTHTLPPGRSRSQISS